MAQVRECPDPLLARIKKHMIGKNDYFACINCGRCVGSCPANAVNDDFNMRIINTRIMEDDQSLLADDAIWDCFYCQACTSLCPRENLDGYKTIIILRDLAIEQGHGLDHVARVMPIMHQFLEKGVLTEGESWLSKESIDELSKINEMTGLQEKIHQIEKAIKNGKKKNGGE